MVNHVVQPIWMGRQEPADILNRFGAEGWELIQTDFPGDSGTIFFLFKRPGWTGFCLPARAPQGSRARRSSPRSKNLLDRDP